ncbi:hypothetical protein PTTG_06409 [Puccinia triticina 1-1 BBBD Race 1]|uniref:Ubiquitin carboxyl-terminal hydrolase n=2 Tax=Puccinia triticina TaxID=208348 RepID=A0A180GJE3_PUCT1|nr:uncharacterized protein PtA15_18A11 [Puccinia triticina]OAV92452.1 hypothetical protein PTTG_06409 [Puccinia triticina 1-1 BBBD Race 1]WAQ92956.1 hypothetical protein PtA15_18A11 [Puccinia triticina]
MVETTPIAGPSIPRSLLLSGSQSKNQTLITNNPAPTTTGTQSKKLEQTNHQLQSDHNSKPSSPPINHLVRIRLADHLLAAPGVSFARSLSAYSSAYGTIRTSSPIIRKNPKRSSSSSSSSPPPSQQDSLPTSSNHPQATPQSPTHSRSKSLSSSTETPPTLPQEHPAQLSADSHPPNPHQSHSTPTPSITPTQPPSSAQVDPSPSLTTPSPQPPPSNKPKSWADLLRRPESSAKPTNSKNTPSNSSRPSPNSRAIGTSAEIIKPVDLNQPLPLSQKLALLRVTNQPYHLIPRGLVNNGNICFANAILQVLVHCPPFFSLLNHIGRIVAHDFKSQTPLLDAMIAFLHEFQTVEPTDLQPILDSTGQLQKYQLPASSATHLRQGDPFIAESVWMATKDNSRFDAMRRGQQEDAQEFLCFFLDSIHEELLFLTSKHDSTIRSKLQKSKTKTSDPLPHLSTNEALNSGEWLEVGAKGQAAVTRSMDACPSPLTELFDLKTRSVLHRSGQKDSVTFEPTNMLQLSIEHPSITTIEQALAHFSSPEVISDMISKNGQRVSATKQVYIESFPPVLVLHLKRFNYNNKDGTVHKSNKQIRFGTELKIPQLVMPPAQRGSQNSQDGHVNFKLFAVVYHHGPHASGGHYTVLIRQPVIDHWIYIDDTQITSIANPNIMLSSTGESGMDSHIHSSSSSTIGSTDQANQGPDGARSSGANGHQNHINGSSNGAGKGNQNIKTPYLLFYTRG